MLLRVRITQKKKKRAYFERKRNLPIVASERVVLFPHGRVTQRCAARVIKKTPKP